MRWVVNATPPPLYPPGKVPGTHCIGGCVDPRVYLEGWEKSRPQPVFDPRTVQPVASRYTDWATPTHVTNRTELKCRYSLQLLPLIQSYLLTFV